MLLLGFLALASGKAERSPHCIQASPFSKYCYKRGAGLIARQRLDGVKIEVGKRKVHNLCFVCHKVMDGISLAKRRSIRSYRTIILQVSVVWPLSVRVIR